MAQGHRTATGRDWVLIDWTGAVRCPWHGALAPEQDYTAGSALCGCDFQALPGGKLRAIQVLPAESVLQTGGENAG